MENSRKEFIGIVCNGFIVMLVLLLPLYNEGTYYLLGDSKYIMFRNLTIGFLGFWVVHTLISALGARMTKISWSTVDSCMLIYAGGVLLSTIASPYRSTATTGYKDWYMGALTLILCVGIYFFVSREYTRSAYPVLAGELGLFLVVAIAFVQRFGIDLFGLYAPYGYMSWESSHMMSTMGNINWFCGYLCVMLPWPVVGFFNSTKNWKQIVYYVISVLALTLTLTQGSDMGILIVIGCLGLGVLYGLKRPKVFRRSVLLALGVCVLCPLMGYMMKCMGTWHMLATDGFLSGLVTEPFWWVLATLLAGIYLLQRKLSEKQVIRLHRILVITAVIIGLGFVLYYLYTLPEGEAWGSGRGGLWKAAWLGFCEADILRKFIGFGPDCFAEYIYRNPELSQWIQMEGRWANTMFANAHNEWLNVLINGGLLGLAAYLSVFISALKRYRGMMLGVMVLILYGMNSLFSFQQVLSTPYLFLVLGICESRYREAVQNDKYEIRMKDAS